MKSVPQTASCGPENAPWAPSDTGRRRVLAHVAQVMSNGTALMARGKAMFGGDNSVDLIYAAARLMEADAFVANALMKNPKTGPISRAIVEQYQLPMPRLAGLNSKKQKSSEIAESRRLAAPRVAMAAHARPRGRGRFTRERRVLYAGSRSRIRWSRAVVALLKVLVCLGPAVAACPAKRRQSRQTVDRFPRHDMIGMEGLAFRRSFAAGIPAIVVVAHITTSCPSVAPVHPPEDRCAHKKFSTSFEGLGRTNNLLPNS